MEHGKEETHFACPEIIERDGGKAVCCGCNGHECKREEQKECKRHNNCFFSISGDSKCFWPPCVRVGCHTSQNSEICYKDHDPRTSDCDFGSQNSGDWEADFDKNYPWLVSTHNRTVTGQIRDLIRLEIDRAERRVKENLEKKVRELPIFLDDNQVPVVRRLDVLNLL